MTQLFKDRLSIILWLVIPVVFGVAHMTMQTTMNIDALMQENGPYEKVQFALIFAAFIYGALCMKPVLKMGKRWLVVWVAMTLGSFYVAAEEISWGQQVFKWSTPESWEKINDHEETNLHNTTQWLDQKPKSVLEAGVYVGSLVIPAVQYLQPALLPAEFAIIYPPAALGVIAVELAALRVAKSIDKRNHKIGFDRASEVQELLMYYFIFLYALVLRRRVKAVTKGEAYAS